MIEIYKSTQKILFGETRAKFFFSIVLSVSIFATSCNKTNGIGLEVQPAADMLNVAYIDTTTLLTRTIKVDSVQTDETDLATYISGTDALLGTYIDPVFGKTSASIYTQLKFSTEAHPQFGSNPKIDWAMLFLVYDPSYYYGQAKNTAQNVSVYKVLDNFYAAGNYFSNKSLSISSSDTTNCKIIPNLTKDAVRFGYPSLLQFWIPLNKTFGQQILNDLSNISSIDSVQKYLKGIYITTENTTGLNSAEGNIVRLKLADPQTKLSVFYHNDSSTSPSSLQYDFSLADVAHFSNFKHDYSTADPDLVSQLSATPPVQNDVVFLQPMSGSKVKIDMPYIMNWNATGASGINKAELVVKVNAASVYQAEAFTAPARLSLYGINDNGSNYLLPDYLFWGTTNFGGFYNADTREYRFNVSSYIQEILSGKKKNNGLHLLILPFDEVMTANRAVIGGGGNGTPYQMKLNITRTKIP